MTRVQNVCVRQSRWRRRFLLLVASALHVSVIAADDVATLSGRTAGLLAAGDVHRYLLNLKAQEYARIEVVQEGIDVGVSLRAPGGSSAAEFLQRSGEPKTLVLIAQESGPYELLVRSLEAQPREGRYVVELTEKRPFIPADRNSVEAVTHLIEAERLWSGGQGADAARRALELYQAAFDQWDILHDPAGSALAARRLGRAHHAMGSPDKAIGPLSRSLQLSEQASDSRGECAALTALAWAEVDVGAMDDATAHAQRALEASRRCGDRRCEAEALNVSGDIHSFTGRTLEAPVLYEQARSISTELRDRRGESQALLNIGYANADLSRVAEAQTAYEAALTLWRSVAERRGEARTLIGVAQLYGIVGETQRSLGYYRQARELVEILADRWGQAVVHSGMGAAYLQLGEPESAIGHYRLAVELFRAAKVAYGEAANLLFLGASLAAVGRHDEALSEELRALASARSVSDRRLEARALQKIGQINADRGRLDDALASQEQALSLAHTGGDLRAETEAQHGIGEILYRQGRYDDARLRFGEALRLAQLGKDRFGESTTLFESAKIDVADRRFEDALAKLRGSLALVEDLRTDVASLDLRASYVASLRERYELTIEVLTQLHAGDAARGYGALAFETAEHARARSLLDGLAEVRELIREGVDPQLLEQETELRQQLNAKAGRLARMTRGERDKAPLLEKEVDELRLAFRELRARIRAESPHYAALTEPQPLRLAEVQKTIVDEHSVLLEYFLGARRSYLWVVTPTGISSHVLPAAEELEHLVRPYREALIGPSVRGPQRQRLSPAAGPVRTAMTVSSALLGPAADTLGATRIVVVSDGILESLPFAALPDPRRTPNDGESIVPLVQEHEVVHLPSASTLALIRGAGWGERRWSKEVLVFGDPVFESDDPRVGRSPRQASPRRPSGLPHPTAAQTVLPNASTLRDAEDSAPQTLPRLLGSGNEARRIAALTTGAELLLGFRATRASVLAPGVKDHRIIHFATHAIVDNDRPELSSIVLSLVDEQGEPRDGFVRLHDIYNLRLPVDLVVLSGCSSAMGRSVAGEGLTSLMRGFMYAGARLVLASLWKVDDEATSELMTLFYAGMWKDGLTPSASLRAAQRAMMGQRRWQHPFYWAGFVLAGDWELK